MSYLSTFDSRSSASQGRRSSRQSRHGPEAHTASPHALRFDCAQHSLTRHPSTDLISHLFDPLLLRSRTATKLLVSPTLVLDFPFLPPTSASHDHNTPRIDRHSPSAQALALFRIPSLIVNFLPGCSWTLEVAQVKESTDEGAESTWVADIDWSLSSHLFPFNKLPLIGSRFNIENVSHRTLVLTFEPSAADTTTEDTVEKHASMDKDSSSPVAGTSKEFAQQSLVLSHVVYSGIPEPSILAGLPGYHFMYVTSSLSDAY